MPTQTKYDRAREAAALPNDQIDPSSLKDIRDVKVDPGLPYEERLRSYIDQIGNPYLYRHGKRIVRVEFAGESTLEECIAHYLSKFNQPRVSVASFHAKELSESTVRHPLSETA